MFYLLLALICLAILIKAAEIFIDQVSAIAKKFKLSSFLLGFTLVSIGTTLPDMVISLYSASRGNTNFALASTIGSAFVNISLLVGVLGLITKYKLRQNDLEKNIPFAIGATLIFVIMLFLTGGKLNWLGGLLAIGLFFLVVLFIKKYNTLSNHKERTKFHWLIFIISFIAMALAGKYTSENFLHFANYFHIRDSFIGFFLVGVGISIPELVASLQVIRKKNLQLSLGNILGAFLINILVIPALASFFTPLDFQPFIFELVYIIFTLIIFIFFALTGKKYYISRKEGIILVLVYLIFIIFQVLW